MTPKNLINRPIQKPNYPFPFGKKFPQFGKQISYPRLLFATFPPQTHPAVSEKPNSK
nr:MAG TPA: hypothetical protein [Caudoviricetes sp.]